MAIEPTSERATGAGECRRCHTYCDKMIEPRDCMAMGCRYLYSHVDDLSGRQYVGCMQRVFRGEVALDALEGSEGFGGIKVTGATLPHCQFTVEQAYPGDGAGHECVNPRFFDCTDAGPEGLRAFDLRNALPQRGQA